MLIEKTAGYYRYGEPIGRILDVQTCLFGRGGISYLFFH